MFHYYHCGTDLRQEESRMAELFDEYVDQFVLGAGPYGVALNFKKTSPKPVAPGSMPASDDVGTLRMSLEHFKVMAFLIKRQIDEIEGQLGIDVAIPIRLMNDLRIAPEDWQKFWKRQQ